MLTFRIAALLQALLLTILLAAPSALAQDEAPPAGEPEAGADPETEPEAEPETDPEAEPETDHEAEPAPAEAAPEEDTLEPAGGPAPEVDDYDEDTLEPLGATDDYGDDEDMLEPLGGPLDAEEGTEEVDEEHDTLDALSVVYEERDLIRTGGAVTLMDEEMLEVMDYDDPHAVLLTAPGVYVRQEDGYGLRPNIGIRGASSERSAKITLMEDEVLLGPAPYSAPAAYYFPLISRMTGVEIFKGPSAVLYGPSTIGGALNMQTRAVPDEPGGMINVAYGSYRYRKIHLHYGASNDWGGILFEGIDIGTNGFKDLDFGGDNTGFVRDDFMLRGHLNTDMDAYTYHRLELKLGYGRERSNETYLGLTDTDFADDPDRRYGSSADDRMDWQRWQVEATYRVGVGDVAEIATTFYYHDFDRLWHRLDSMGDGDPSLSQILTYPDSGANQLFYRVLTGAENTSDSTVDGINAVDNDRQFVSTGVQSVASVEHEKGDYTHQLEVGVRLHMDDVRRVHTLQSYDMFNEQLVRNAIPDRVVTDNAADTMAFAAWGMYGMRWNDLTVSPGLRVEYIVNNYENLLLNPGDPGANVEGDQYGIIPGLGVQYALTEGHSLVGGVYRGFSPVAPGQLDSVDPEYSINSEFGYRYSDLETGTQGEAIAFFNDYRNILGTCTFSSGCDPSMIDEQFNGGRVYVWGVEAVATHRFELPKELELPVRGTYTYTGSSFQDDFQSSNPVWGNVQAGDPLAYVPEHQLRLEAGLVAEKWDVNFGFTFVGEMSEMSGTGGPLAGFYTDALATLDLVAGCEVIEDGRLYLRAENLTNNRSIVSRRPFGARPNSPLMVQVGFRYDI